MLCLDVGSEDLNSSPHACTPSIIFTEPSPQPCIIFIFQVGNYLPEGTQSHTSNHPMLGHKTEPRGRDVAQLVERALPSMPEALGSIPSTA